MSAKRPDVAQRLINRKNILETVVPCGLSKRLGVSLPDECRALLRKEIDLWVISVSKIVHRLSIIFNRLLIYLLHNNLPLPSLETSLFTGLALHGMRHSKQQPKEEYRALIEDFCSNEFDVTNNMFPKIQRNRGDMQAITIACKRYETNFKNSLFVPFFRRQKSYIQTWMRIEGIQGIHAWSIQNYINGSTTRGLRRLPCRIQDFIREERKLLPNKVTEKSLKKNYHSVISYYYHILQYYHATEEGKKFRLAPLCQIKCHFLTIDNTVLREILINVRSKTKQEEDFPSNLSHAIDEKNMHDDVWKTIFNYDGLRRRRRFNHQVDTNGDKVCFHFQVTKKQYHRGKRRSRSQERRVISIDPGRANLITAYDEVEEKYHRLTRRQYYKSSGMLKRIKCVTHRNLQMKGVYEAMSKTPTRSAEDKDWYNYQMILTRHYDLLWAFKTKKVWKKEEMRVSCLKQKCLDRFFNGLKKKGEKKSDLVIAYGAACIQATGKGELSVPVKYVYKKCCERYKTEKEDERYSTKMHHKCRGTTVAVRVRSRMARGLRWCPTCRELVSRDNNACKNIMESYKATERPKYLCDTYEREEGVVKRLNGCNHTLRIRY